MDPLSAIAGCKQIITQCGECTVVLAKWMGQAKFVDRRLQSFYDEVSALQLTNENMKRNLELPSMIEAARSTNDPSGHLWSQVALTMEDCRRTMVAANQTVENTKVGRFIKPLRALTESMSTGELARYLERIQMFNVCLQLPLHMVTISYQLANRDDTEAAQMSVEQNIFSVNTTIKTLNKRIRVLRPIYTNSRRRKSEVIKASNEADDVDAAIYENMENLVDRSSKFMVHAKTLARSTPEVQQPSFQPPEHMRRHSDWRVSDTGFTQDTRHIIDAWMPRVPTELPTPDPSDRGQSPTSPQNTGSSALDGDSNLDDDTSLELSRHYVETGQEDMEKGDFVSAEENFHEALEMLEQNEYLAHIAIQPCDITLLLAQCCFQQGKLEDAISLLLPLSAPDDHNPEHAPDQEQTYSADYMLATFYVSISNLAEAEKHALKSFSGRRRLLRDSHPKTFESTQLVVDIYRKMGKEARAKAYSKFLKPHSRSGSVASMAPTVSPVSPSTMRTGPGEAPIVPVQRANTMESVAPIPPVALPPVYPTAQVLPQNINAARLGMMNMDLNSSRATVTTKTHNPFLDDDSSSTSITRIDTQRESFSMPRHLLKPKFLAIKSLSCESRDKAVDMAMKLLKKYDPDPEKILIHRTDDLKKNIRKRGSDMGLAATGHGYAPIHFFCELSEHQATTEVELLIEEGVDLGSIRYKPGLNKVEPMIPLQIAIDKGHQDIARVIIEALSAQAQIGRSVVDINLVKDRDGMPPLLAACRRGQVRIVGQLLEYGATVNGEFPDMWYGNSLLHDACVRCDTDMIRLLLEYQDGRAHRRRDIGTITQEDKFGTTPLMYAAISNNLHDQNLRKQKLKNRLVCMRLLLESGSLRKSFEHDLRVRDKKGKDVFTYVMDEGDLRLRKLLEQFDKIGRRNAPPTELE